ncbi:hypothetical protein [Streptomyces sp. NPDC059788]|uniref:hypothetical protein n=1 Tax=Streptomyces sp. NPDC059788 TaxID=3346948 RepID=UPI003669498E
MSKTVGAEGWTVVHQARQKHYDDRYYGQFLGTRKDGRWIVGRMWSGRSMDDGFHDGGWDWSKRFAEPSSTDAADAALKSYVEMSHETFVWNRVFEQRVGEAIDAYWAGPEVPGAPRLSAGWCRTPDGLPGGSTVGLPFHEAKYRLLQYLRSTESTARADLSPRTFNLHDAVELIRQANGPFRFQHGYNAYWLADDAS